jgi:hypothetical protein
MKSASFLPVLFGILALPGLGPVAMLAAEGSVSTSTVTSSPPARASVEVVAAQGATTQRLPYGADDVLKLSRGKISDDIILTYVQTSGTIYDLKPRDIVHLKEQGVSDKVVNAMLDQRRHSEEKDAARKESAEANAAPPFVPGTPEPSAAPVIPPPFTPEPIADYPNPAPVEVMQPPVSTLYVIPYGPSGYRPYYRTMSGYGSVYVIPGPGSFGRVSSFGHSHRTFRRR